MEIVKKCMQGKQSTVMNQKIKIKQPENDNCGCVQAASIDG